MTTARDNDTAPTEKPATDTARTPVHIRRLSAADAQDYRTLMLDAYTRFADAFTSTASERAALPISWWEERVAAGTGNSVVFGAFVGDALVGTVGVEFETRDKTRHKSLLIGMFVLPEQRGLGLGRSLVQTALRHAAARPGSLVMQLVLTEGNARAQRLYESCGFEVFGIEPMGLNIGSEFRAKVHMWRKLADIDGMEPT